MLEFYLRKFRIACVIQHCAKLKEPGFHKTGKTWCSEGGDSVVEEDTSFGSAIGAFWLK